MSVFDTFTPDKREETFSDCAFFVIEMSSGGARTVSISCVHSRKSGKISDYGTEAFFCLAKSTVTSPGPSLLGLLAQRDDHEGGGSFQRRPTGLSLVIIDTDFRQTSHTSHTHSAVQHSCHFK